MKRKRLFILLTFFIVFRVISFAQDSKVIQHSTNNDKISNPDSVFEFIVSDSNSVYPSESIYGKSWDTLYIRLSRHVKPSVDDTLIMPLLTSDFSDFTMPVPGQVLSEFGWRHGRVHAGIDLRLEKGDSVYSSFDGVVRISRYFSGYGNIVVVRHYNGLETCYAHLSKRITKVNQKVKAGQVLGLGGRTGRATCNHLHFEVRYLEEPMNPRLVFDFTNQKINNDTLLVSNESFFHKGRHSGKSKASPQQFKIEKGANYYTIKQGDTLYSIAKRSGTTVAALCQSNNISETSILRIGQKIKL